MNFAVYLITQSLQSIPKEEFARSIIGTSQKLFQILKDFEQTIPGTTNLKWSKILKPTASILSFPDAVWNVLLQNNLRNNCYPLGEINERSVKIFLNDLVHKYRIDAKKDPNNGELNIEDFLPTFFMSNWEKGFLKKYYSQYLFQICIDYLRRDSNDTNQNWNYGYHFNERGKMISLAAEKSYRKKLINQCTVIAETLETHALNKRGVSLNLLQNIEFLIRNKNVPFPQQAEEIIATRFPNLDLSTYLKEKYNFAINNIIGTASVSNIKKKYSVSDKSRRFIMHSKNPNVTTPHKKIEACLGRKLKTYVKDILDIGISVYMADIYTKRQENLERDLNILLPVRHIDKWEKTNNYLELAINKLGRDSCNINFSKRRERLTKDNPKIKLDNRCVCLFSGGVDSFAGLIWALNNGLAPVVVSHYANNKLSNITNELLIKLNEKYRDQLSWYNINRILTRSNRPKELPQEILTGLKSLEVKQFLTEKEMSLALIEILGKHAFNKYREIISTNSRELCHFNLYVNKSKSRAARYRLGNPPSSIMKQYARSILFLSLATAIAIELGISKVYIFENGPIAINPTFSEARVNTKTAHPHLLFYFNKFLNGALDIQISIENPFLYLTKGEISKIISNSSLGSLAQSTISCWNTFRVPLIAKRNGRKREKNCFHDGYCLPCMIRRSSFKHANIKEQKRMYLYDFFEDYSILNKDTKISFTDYIRFCKNILTLPDCELLSFSPDLSISCENVVQTTLIEMYKRHSLEMMRYFNKLFASDIKMNFTTFR